MQPTLVILAAGLGSRYGSLKQLDPLGPAPGNAALLDYSIYDARRAGFGRVVVVIRPEVADAFRDLSDRWRPRVELAYALQRLPADRTRAKPWGTGEAVLAAREHLTTPFGVANADDFYGRTAFQSLAGFLTGVTPASDGPLPTYAVVGYPLRGTLSDSGGVNRGLCRVAPHSDLLEEIEEIEGIERAGAGGRVVLAGGRERLLRGDEIVSMNLWGFTPAFLAPLAAGFEAFRAAHAGEAKAEFLIPDVVQEQITTRRARVRVLAGGTTWCGVTFPDDRGPARAMLTRLEATGEYPNPLWT